jgi:hypothetical protein
MFGLRPDQEVNTIEDFYALVHPNDRANVIAAFDRTRHEGIHLDTEFRVNRPDGTQRWLIDKGEVLLDEHGNPERMTGAGWWHFSNTGECSPADGKSGTGQHVRWLLPNHGSTRNSE